jgi:hypothetical protein
MKRLIMAICCFSFLCLLAGCNQSGGDVSPSDSPLGSSETVGEESNNSSNSLGGLGGENELPLVPIQ